MKKIYFIGGGQMVEAIIRAVIHNNIFENKQINVYDINHSRLKYLAETYGIGVVFNEKSGFRDADLIIIGVRPQDDIKAISGLIDQYADQNATIISIVAGVTLKKIESYLHNKFPIVRVIPNTLTDTGFGYSAATLNKLAEKNKINSFLNSFGKVEFIEESLLDIFTGYGVAGPNYIYYFIESLADAGVLAGLPRDLSWKIALENTSGAVEMLKITGKHPRQLLDINNSPGGVGINALFELNKSDFAAGLQNSVLTAVKRTSQLGGEPK
ncbi:pyrroline-5-carboxylate reductase [Niallia sp. Marseille-Q9988]